MVIGLLNAWDNTFTYPVEVRLTVGGKNADLFDAKFVSQQCCSSVNRIKLFEDFHQEIEKVHRDQQLVDRYLYTMTQAVGFKNLWKGFYNERNFSMITNTSGGLIQF